MPDNIAIHPALLDLQWCISSPSILAPVVDNVASLQAIKNDSALSLDISTISVQDFQSHLSQNSSHFLGAYFEQLWKFYLQAHPRFELIASNLQIHDKGKTIGEFDFIAYDKYLQQHIHQELAIKFYLGWPSCNSTLWIGPQEVDRLDKKLDRLLNHQIKLPNNPIAKEKLKQLGIEKITPQIVMKGYLFEPLHLPGIRHSSFLSPNSLKGNWLPFSQLDAMLQQERFAHCYWKPLEKKQWLRPAEFDSSDTLIYSKDLLTFIDEHRRQEHERPILLSCLRKDNTPNKNGYKEDLKLFLVSDNWPRLSKSSPPLQATSMNNQYI